MSTPARSLLAADRAQVISLPESLSYSEAGIVSRTLLQTPELRLILFSFAAGQELTAHSSRRRAWVQILEGECDFLFEGQWQRLRAGTGLHLPPSHPHAVKASAGPFAMLLTLGSDLPDAVSLAITSPASASL